MRSPRVPRVLLDRLIDPRLRDAVVGDLDELFALERTNEPLRAWMSYWARAAGVLVRLGVHPAARPQLLEPPSKGDGVMATFLTDLRHGGIVVGLAGAFGLTRFSVHAALRRRSD